METVQKEIHDVVRVMVEMPPFPHKKTSFRGKEIILDIAL
jgi:hypothetical protein